MAERRAAWRRKGGMESSHAARIRKHFSDAPLSSDDLIRTLSRGVRRVEAGDLEANLLNAMSAAARAIASIREVSELESRIEALEAQADARKKVRRIA